MSEKNKKDRNRPATLADVENSADEVMRSCQVQFTAIDAQFAEVHKKFDLMDRRFDRLEAKIDARFEHMEEKIDARFEQMGRQFNELRGYMRDHEKRLTHVEKELQFA
jgi:hypothetical protein